MSTNQTHKEFYTGQIVLKPNEDGDKDKLLGLVGAGIDLLLVEEIEEKINLHGGYLSVRYWSSDRQLSVDLMKEEFIKTLCGLSSAEYQVHASETSGYLWTTQKLIVGGHNLLEELKNQAGKYLHLEIDFSFTPNPDADQAF